jgi:exodeoxyribonuclease V alpha subunit
MCHEAMISAEEWVTASGEWTNDHAHWLQFCALFMEALSPF